jgi:prevent-host-death family protein
MTALPISMARAQFADTVNRVAYAGERIVIGKGKRRVALVSMADLELIQRIENKLDIAGAKKALKEPGSISLATVKEKLGL